MDYNIARMLARKVDARCGNVRDSSIQRLGGGMYGSAWQHTPSGLVLKVGRGVTDGTMGFISRCAEFYQRNGRPPEGCPMVLHFRKEDGYWWAVMERVSPIGGDYGDPDFVSVSKYPERHRRGSMCATHREAKEYLFKCVQDVCGKITSLYESGCVDVWAADIYKGNYGTTEDGRLVVFDPMSGYLKVSKFKRKVVHKRQYGPSRGRWAN